MKRTILKEKPQITRYEQETVVTFNNEEPSASLYSCNPVIIKYMNKLVKEFPDTYTITEEILVGKNVFAQTYSFPKKYGRPKRPIVFSEERKEAARENLRKIRERKENETK